MWLATRGHNFVGFAHPHIKSMTVTKVHTTLNVTVGDNVCCHFGDQQCQQHRGPTANTSVKYYIACPKTSSRQAMPYFWLVSADNVSRMSAPAPQGPPLLANTVGPQNNIKMTTDTVKCRPRMTGSVALMARP